MDIERNNTQILQGIKENLNQSWTSILMGLDKIESFQKTNISYDNLLFHSMHLHQYNKMKDIEIGKDKLQNKSFGCKNMAIT